MKIDFTCEQREDGVYIINVDPNDELKMPIPFKAIYINDKPIKTCEDFHNAYKKAEQGDHKFMLLIGTNGQKQYYDLPITP